MIDIFDAAEFRADAVAALAESGPEVRAVAVWCSREEGSIRVWPQAHADNRRSRVLARIARYEFPCDPDTLVIVSR